MVGSPRFELVDAPPLFSKSDGLQPPGEIGALVLALGFEPRHTLF